MSDSEYENSIVGSDNESDIDDENDITSKKSKDINDKVILDEDEDEDNIDDDEDDEDIENMEDMEYIDNKEKKKIKSNKNHVNNKYGGKDIEDDEDELEMELEDDESMYSDSDSDSEIEYDDNYLKKLDNNLIKNSIEEFHPESKLHNYDEVLLLANVKRNNDGVIIDDNHRTIPILTKYEKTRILGIRAKQIDNGAKPFVDIPENVIDGYTIALMELKEKKIPFIIRRPLPNGVSEYWYLKDLEVL